MGAVTGGVNTHKKDREELQAIAELLPRAIRAGISKREIERLTGVSRPWIDRLLHREKS